MAITLKSKSSRFLASFEPASFALFATTPRLIQPILFLGKAIYFLYQRMTFKQKKLDESHRTHQQEFFREKKTRFAPPGRDVHRF